MRRRQCGAILAAGCLAAWIACATPHVPATDGEVLETLPQGYDPQLASVAGLRREALHDPLEPAPQLRLGRAYIDIARRDGDPRFLGYAQAVLARLTAAGPPYATPAASDAAVLQATVLQSQHQFDAALRLLDGILASRPLQAQALLTRATVLQVRGRFVEAQRDCAALWRAADDVTAELCLAGVAAVTGRDRSAGALLHRALDTMPADDASSRLWACTLLAEMASRGGDVAGASHWYDSALRAGPRDRYVLASYADFLLEHGRAGDVLRITSDELRDDNLLLRRALAQQQLGERSAQLRSMQTLRERYLAGAQRGDRTHLREQARFALELQRDAAESLALARANWAVQKEPADLAVLLRSARAAGDAATLAEAQRWLGDSGLAWPGLQRGQPR